MKEFHPFPKKNWNSAPRRSFHLLSNSLASVIEIKGKASFIMFVIAWGCKKSFTDPSNSPMNEEFELVPSGSVLTSPFAISLFLRAISCLGNAKANEFWSCPVSGFAFSYSLHCHQLYTQNFLRNLKKFMHMRKQGVLHPHPLLHCPGPSSSASWLCPFPINNGLIGSLTLI